MYDYIIIGSGYGGLSSAALLANSGLKVLLLESHSLIGGCASYYKRGDFLFDVGATTLSGVAENRPMGHLFKTLDIKPKLKKMDVGLVVKMDGKELYRYAEKDKWIETSADFFGNKSENKVWDKIYKTEEMAWEFVMNNYGLPPSSLIDIASLIKASNLKYAGLVPAAFNSLDSYLPKLLLRKENYYRFLSEQLLITSQNSIKDTPYLTAAMGLAYPSETYYPYGGMKSIADLINKKFIQCGGEIKFKNRVNKIEIEKEGYKISTVNGNVYHTKGVISNIPIWNLGIMMDGREGEYFKKKAKFFDSAWGAFTINFAIESNLAMPSAYYQVHTRTKIPYSHGNSMFVTFSEPDDFERAPKGWKTVSISLHTDVSDWELEDYEDYDRRKEFVTKKLLEEFDNQFPEFSDSAKVYVLSGTPNTFEFYTKRYRGYVGGIPHSLKKSLINIPPNKTPFKNFYIVGDTVFPGQGIPAVVLGALNIHKKINDSSIYGTKFE
ncbi:MAG: NAD(P)/FAD-dependent oxidoreductase [Melioribacteraceae bacterium]|nr:NAD(P)/FAD-dependent oxidoreductase [Melioribacteraceae bacterium]